MQAGESIRIFEGLDQSETTAGNNLGKKGILAVRADSKKVSALAKAFGIKVTVDGQEYIVSRRSLREFMNRNPGIVQKNIFTSLNTIKNRLGNIQVSCAKIASGEGNDEDFKVILRTMNVPEKNITQILKENRDRTFEAFGKIVRNKNFTYNAMAMQRVAVDAFYGWACEPNSEQKKQALAKQFNMTLPEDTNISNEAMALWMTINGFQKTGTASFSQDDFANMNFRTFNKKMEGVRLDQTSAANLANALIEVSQQQGRDKGKEGVVDRFNCLNAHSQFLVLLSLLRDNTRLNDMPQGTADDLLRAFKAKAGDNFEYYKEIANAHAVGAKTLGSTLSTEDKAAYVALNELFSKEK